MSCSICSHLNPVNNENGLPPMDLTWVMSLNMLYECGVREKSLKSMRLNLHWTPHLLPILRILHHPTPACMEAAVAQLLERGEEIQGICTVRELGTADPKTPSGSRAVTTFGFTPVLAHAHLENSSMNLPCLKFTSHQLELNKGNKKSCGSQSPSN